jgi:hypothetical protein
VKILLIALLAISVYADTPPVPKVFKGMHGQKGQYQVDILEPAGKSPKMTIAPTTWPVIGEASVAAHRAPTGCSRTRRTKR